MAGASVNPLQITIGIYEYIWIFGMIALALYTAISYWRLSRKVDTAVRYKDNIFQSENVNSPFVLGIIKPRIYLPFNMNGQNLEHVVAHEQAHIRRKDHLWKPLGFLLLTIHWFNPLMWLAYVLLCRDIELACDEKVIKELGNEQRADYTQALVVCSVNRRMIAACPLAFGEVGVKDRVKSVMNYKKPAFWIIILAVIACVIVAVCFLTNPMGFQFDEATHTIVSANHFDMRNADDAVAIEMNPAQISELSSRLAGVKNTKKSDEYGGFTPGYQISALLEDGTYIRINGYSLSDNDMVDIEWNGERYVVSDGEFQDYLSRICVGGDVAVAEPVPSVTKWFDYLETPDEMQWGGRHEINLPEFPDVTFRWTYGEMMAVTGNEITSLYTGMPIWNAYFCDLTGDGLPELCSTISWGSGMIDNRVTIYDYANGASYELSDRGYFDFTLRFNEADGYLYVDKKKYNTDELVETGRLVFKNNCIQIEGFSNEAHQVFQAEILEDHNGYYLVKPVEGSWELNSADRIEVPIRNAHPSPEPEIGDVIEIEYSGEILETYPARIADVYSIKVAAEKGRLNGFELNFDGNTSLQHKMVLTEDAPYWCIFINNEGSNNITVEIGGHVYEVEAETYGHIFRDELWDAGTYSASFASINGMEGTATCYTYKYRMEVTGRLNNAVEDTTYVILSNIENITFEQAWKASGLSGDTADYFDPAEAVIINRTR